MEDLPRSKLILLFTIVVFLVLSVSAQQPPQSHPLSEITPIDTDLEMSDQRIENVSALQLNNGPNTNGLKLDGFTISDQGEAAKFTLDFSDDQWEIRDSNLSLEGNSIRNFFDSGCPNGQALVTINDDGGFECTSISGDVSGDYVNITGDTMEGDLNLNSYSIVDPAEVDGVNISNPGNAIQISGNQYIIPSNAVSTDEIANSAVTSSEISDGTILNEDLSSDSVTFSSGDHLTGGGTVALGNSATFNVDGSTLTWSELGISQWEVNVSNLGAANSDLDMNGFSLNNYYSSGCQSGYVMVDVENSGNIQCVNVTNEVQDSYVNREGDSMTGRLEMNSNQISGLQDPDNSQDAATKSFVETYADTNDDNGTDDQTLSTTDDISGTDDEITIENGNSITIDDDFAADDQALGTSGDQITLDNGGSITAPYANNSDQLDGVQLSNINWGDVAMAQSDVGPADVGDAGLSTGSSISGSTYDGTTAYTWNVNWQDANDLGSGGTISDFSAANDLNSGGGISDFSNANDLDGNGNINDFSAANDLDGSGNIADFSAADDLDSSGNVVNFDQATDLGSNGEISANSVGNEDIDNSVNIDLGTLDVSGGSVGDGTQSGLTVDSNGNLYFDGSLNFPGDVNTINAQQLNGSLIPDRDADQNIGSSSKSWKNIYLTSNIYDGGGNSFFDSCGGSDSYIYSINSDGTVNCATDTNTNTELSEQDVENYIFDTDNDAGNLGLNGNDIVDSGTTIWDSSNNYIPQGRVQQGSGSGLDADQIDGVQLGNINWGDVAMAQSDVGPGDVGDAGLSTGSSISGSTYDGTTAYTWNVNWQDANDLGSGGSISDFSAANDLNSGGGISDFSNANDLDGNGNIADFSAANGLNSNGQVVDTECSGNDYLAGDGTCNVDSYEANTDNQGLANVLSNDNTANNQNIEDLHRIGDGGQGNYFDFTSNSGYVEVQTGGGAREEIVTEDTYIDQIGSWMGDNDLIHIDANNGLSGSNTYGLTDPIDLSVKWEDSASLDSTGDLNSIESGDGSVGTIGTTSNDRLYLAPVRGGSVDYSYEFGFRDSDGEWYTDSNFDVGGQLTAGSTNCGNDQFIAGDGSCNNDNVEDYHDLADVLNDNNVASQNIDMNGNDVTSSGGEMCVGQYC